MQWKFKYRYYIPLFLSVIFIASVLFIAFDVRRIQSRTENYVTAISVLGKFRNDLTTYLVNRNHIDLMSPEIVVDQLQKNELSSTLNIRDYEQILRFTEQFNYGTSKIDVQREIDHLNSVITQMRGEIGRHSVQLQTYWIVISILGILSCMFALLSSILLILNRNQNLKLNEKTQQLQQAKMQAEEATQAKSDFLNVMSHEIRTPLNAVIGLTHILSQLKPTAEQRRHIELLQFSSENLLSLINDILDFGKIEAGKVQLEERAFVLEKNLKKIVSTLEPFANSKKLRLLLELHNTNETRVLGDPTRLGQIIFNLVNNAIKFTHRGYVKLVLENKAESETDITYSITVKDTGIGIDAEKQKTIFEEFEQADAQTNRKFGGSGLGLTISQKLLQHMNSGLILSSKVGEGTEFTFQITLNKALDIDTGFNHLETKQIKGSKNKKVLIVEDNKINLLILERFVQDLNLIPVTAINGKEGVEKATSESFDLILMDLQMPEMDGYEASKKIAESLAENKPPILAISAANESNIRQNLVEYGMEDYVTKPIDPEQFNRKVMLYV